MSREERPGERMRAAIRPEDDASSSRTMQPPREECLHVAAAVSDEDDEHSILKDAIDHTIRLEEELPVLANPERKQLSGYRTTLRETGNPVADPEEVLQQCTAAAAPSASAMCS